SLSAGVCYFSIRRFAFSRFVTPRPPCSPLRPYTTLFRSRRVGRQDLQRAIHATAAAEIGGEDLDLRARRGRADVGDAVDEVLGADRQSTRLNSSHVKNSDDVFCLKNKTFITANHCGTYSR